VSRGVNWPPSVAVMSMRRLWKPPSVEAMADREDRRLRSRMARFCRARPRASRRGRGRFIEEQPVRPRQQRARQRNALLLAAGEALRPRLLAIETREEAGKSHIDQGLADIASKSCPLPPDR